MKMVEEKKNDHAWRIKKPVLSVWERTFNSTKEGLKYSTVMTGCEPQVLENKGM